MSRTDKDRSESIRLINLTCATGGVEVHDHTFKGSWYSRIIWHADNTGYSVEPLKYYPPKYVSCTLAVAEHKNDDRLPCHYELPTVEWLKAFHRTLDKQERKKENNRRNRRISRAQLKQARFDDFDEYENIDYVAHVVKKRHDYLI